MIIEKLLTKNTRKKLKTPEIYFIVNPFSAAGKTQKRWRKLLPVIKRKWGRAFEFSLTQSSEEARRLAWSLVNRGCKKIIVMGGDGTIQQAINGILMAEKEKIQKVCVGILSSGTGQGLAMSLGLPVNVEDQLQIIEKGRSQKIDLALVEFQNRSGQSEKRWFVNECQIGIGGRVVQAVESRIKYLGGRWAYALTALRQLFYLHDCKVKIATAEGGVFNGKLIGLVVGNGSFTGGGMRLTPQARPDDGKLDVLLIKPQSLPKRFFNLGKVYSGHHIQKEEFEYFQTTGLQIQDERLLPVAADGELLGSTPCTIRLFPSAISIFI